ncbi:MAG: hypothetical protein MK211_10410 [Flavobacteriales bacterium]|jgi:hypothetical protein|uniref:hypothetical protein n=1 Tax=Candidatus Ulvibacter alkanivorans TaxID=2267620 RepID=UPI000DF3E551|nr:hypothetical protein [Candidatus Ulvibacter alkanivorans]MCH2490550.1 hypothetical protein [Flavobacteriales bacterium]
MYTRLLVLFVAAVTMISCQFSETMVLNEDGTGRMTIGMDVSEMMAFSGEFAKDSTMVKTDTTVAFRDILIEKKDSIAKLPKAEQERLKAMENYNVRVLADPETDLMIMSVFTDFKNVSEANDLMKAFEQGEGLMPSTQDVTSESNNSSESDLIGVRYSYTDGTFTRDSYIKDEEKHRKQIDSLKEAEAFMSGMKYNLKYTFPKRIKSSSIEDATFSLDGKTIEVERTFLAYFKNPDVLDLVVELEE